MKEKEPLRNINLAKAKQVKNDEFYTRYEDIERELAFYGDCFRDKIVYCNCDNPYESEFVHYFYINFTHLGLKELHATCWSGKPMRYAISLFGDDCSFQKPYHLHVIDPSIPLKDSITLLKGNGDFASNECKRIMEASDIIVTNPPFSLLSSFMELLSAYDKDFLIICNKNILGVSSTIANIAESKWRVGHSVRGKDFLFNIPKEHADFLVANNRVESYRRKHGCILGRAPALWLTSLEYHDCSRSLVLTHRLSDGDYPEYDNYHAIEVGKVSEIPYDYSGIMGVPITFLVDYNPEQFEILAGTDAQGSSTWSFCKLQLRDKPVYKRIFIRNKHPEK